MLTPTEKARGRKQAQRSIAVTVCEECGTTRDLTRHHRDEDPTNNDPVNVQTLCRSCHTKTHWAAGTHPRRQPNVCVTCGREFMGRRKRDRTCSPECLSEAGQLNARKRWDR
jgi:hypothetical protein